MFMFTLGEGLLSCVYGIFFNRFVKLLEIRKCRSLFLVCPAVLAPFQYKCQ